MRTLNEIYNENESNNSHIDNARLVVMIFGTERELNIIDRVIARKGRISSYTLTLFNTIINVGLKYEDQRLAKGDDIFIHDNEVID